MQVCLKVVQSSEEAQSFLADGCHPLKSAFAFDRLLLRPAADGVPAGGQTIMWYMFLQLRVGMHFPHFSLYDVLYITNHANKYMSGSTQAYCAVDLTCFTVLCNHVQPEHNWMTMKLYRIQ